MEAEDSKKIRDHNKKTLFRERKKIEFNKYIRPTFQVNLYPKINL